MFGGKSGRMARVADRQVHLTGGVLVLAGLLLGTACGAPSAANPSVTSVTRAAPSAATMSPADMATMAQSTASAAPAATPQATTAAPAVLGVNTAPTSAPAATSAPATTNAPTTTSAPAATSAPAPTSAPAVTATPAGPSTTVTVTLADTSIKLSAASVPAGTVTFTVMNGGTTDHEFVVLQTATAQGALAPDPANAGTVLEPGFLGRVAKLAPHATGSLTLTLGPGSYVLICNQPAHYSALGMHTAFTVK